jgi:hypothetical protein
MALFIFLGGKVDGLMKNLKKTKQNVTFLTNIS